MVNDENSPESDGAIWLCLNCGREGCGRAKEGHALGHYDRQHSHCVVLNLEDFSCWCYKCDNEIYITSGLAADFILEVKRRFNDSDNSEPSDSDNHIDIADFSVKSAPPKKTPKKTSQNNRNFSGQKLKGLANIGNTCFYNSVIQCLFHSTRIEKDINNCLNASCYEVQGANDTSFSIPLKPSTSCLTSVALRDLFVEMDTSTTPLIYPNGLFNQVCAKVPRFRSYQQQDAHELLRTLLDSVKNEEVNRATKSFSEKFLSSGKKADDKTMLKQVTDVVSDSTVIDKTFGGQMVDTIVCLECHSINTVLQSFLDISLPLKKPNCQSWGPTTKDSHSSKMKKKQLREKKKNRKAKEDPNGNWDDEEDEEVKLALAMSMESENSGSTSGRPDSGLGSGSSGSDPVDAAFDGLPIVTPTESDELIDGNLLASIAALQINSRESFPSNQKMSNKELRRRLQTISNRPPPEDDDKSLYSALYWYTEREELKGLLVQSYFLSYNFYLT